MSFTPSDPRRPWSIDRITEPSQENIKPGVFENHAKNLGEMLQRRLDATPDKTAYRFRDSQENWQTSTWKEFGQHVHTLSAGLLALGFSPGDSGAIIGGTSMDWVYADLSIQIIGGISVAIYPTSVPEEIAYILNDSESRIVIVDEAAQVDKLRHAREELPNVDRVFIMDSSYEDTDDWVGTVDEIFQAGKELLESSPDTVTDAVQAVDGDQPASFQYTSGTTGRPKGAILTHQGWTSNMASMHAADLAADDDVHFLWLPMAHIFGRVLIYLSIEAGIETAIDGRIDKIVDNLQDVKPTLMGAAPRIFEKAYAGVMAQFDGDGVKAKLGKVSIALALKVTEQRLRGETPSAWDRFKLGIADKVVLKKIRAAMGGNIRMFISGSAPINKDITKWFTAMGMPILEGYGLTEGGITHVTRLDAYRVGTVGFPMPGVEVKLADDGELLIKAPWLLAGYHNREEETKEVLPGDGYLHTGDIAEFTDKHFLKITDRKKALYKTSNGKYVAPGAIESEFKGLCPLAMELVTYGEGKKYVTAMVVLEEKATRGWCEKNDIPAGDDVPFADLTKHEKVHERVQQALEEMNQRLNSWEQVKRFRILDRELDIEKDELTPSLKLRRKHVHKTMEDKFEALYQDPLEDGFEARGVEWVSFSQPAFKDHPILDDEHDIHLRRPRRHKHDKHEGKEK